MTTPELSIIIAIIALIVATGRLWASVHPIWMQYRNKRLLKKQFSLGPYDEFTIEQSTRYYIRPKCSNIDPAQELEIRQAAFATREDLFSKVDEFLRRDDVAHRHLLILADSGTGKTSFVLNYYAYNSRRPKHKRHNLTLVPLGDKRADDLINDHPDQKNTVIFLDALDEDTRAITDHGQRIKELMEACRNYKRVIMTCRTQFFPKDEEIPIETGIARLGPRRAGNSGVYEFWKLYLSPFDDDEVEQYLKKRYPFWAYRTRRKAQEIANKIPLLTVRPMLLAHIPDIIASGREITSSYELYEAMVEAWLEREKAWVDKAALREFSERLAVNLHINRAIRGMERVPKIELEELAKEWGIELQDWQLSGRSLLNRDAVGNYKFSHRSIMEFLFVKRFIIGDQECRKSFLTDQMERFLREADLSGTDLRGANLSRANLSRANLRGANLRGAYLSGANLSGANLFVAHMTGAYLIDADLRGANLSGVNLSEANLSRANLREVQLDGANLSGADLNRANLKKAYLSEANLKEVNLLGADLGEADLNGANLSSANLIRVSLGGADLIRASLLDTDLREADLREANLFEADLSEANLSGANLGGTNLSGANLSRAYFSRANLNRANLDGADLSGTKLRDAKIDDKTRLNSKWRLVWKIVNQGVDNQTLIRADLSRANLSGTNLSGANLREADLSEADLSEADLRNANLRDANLRLTNLLGANLLGAYLSGANLGGAKHNDATKGFFGFDPEKA